MNNRTHMGGEDPTNGEGCGFLPHPDGSYTNKLKIIPPVGYHGIIDVNRCVKLRDMFGGFQDDYSEYIKLKACFLSSETPVVIILGTTVRGKVKTEEFNESTGETEKTIKYAVEKPGTLIGFFISLEHRKLFKIEMNESLIGGSSAQSFNLATMGVTRDQFRLNVDNLKMSNTFKHSLINATEYIGNNVETIIENTKKALVYDVNEIHPENQYLDFLEDYIKLFK